MLKACLQTVNKIEHHRKNKSGFLLPLSVEASVFISTKFIFSGNRGNRLDITPVLP